MITPFHPTDVAIVTVPATPVAVFQHRGDPALVPASVQRFIACRKHAGLPPSISPTFTVLHTDPEATPPGDFRMDLCAGTNRPVLDGPVLDGPVLDGPVPDDGLVPGLIPGGRCAVLRVTCGQPSPMSVLPGCPPVTNAGATSRFTCSASPNWRGARRSSTFSCHYNDRKLDFPV